MGRLCELRLTSFRNLADGAVRWDDGLNLVSGDNGHGKTNLLEAVFFLSMGRSFRTSRIDRLVRAGERRCRLEATVEHRGVRHDLAVAAGGGSRERALDGKTAGLEMTLGIFSCLAFAAPRLDLFRGTPADRRRFMDRGVAAVQPDLIPVYREYTRGLRQKNELLRRARESGRLGPLEAQVAAFNNRLAAAGARLQTARAQYVARLQEALDTDERLQSLVPGGAPALEYRPSPRPESGAPAPEGLDAATLRAALDRHMAAEARRGHALVGCQRDTLHVTQTGRDLAAYGSSGQQRAALIALKICKMLVQKALTGDFPVLLVDDVDAELDAERTRRALRILDGPSQVLVASAAGSGWAAERSGTPLIQVRNGIIERT